jgi:REG-2-like HAD superfamily hydrolase
MPVKAVFIDVGNTLLYEKPSRFEIYAEGARRRGLAITTEEMRDLMRDAHRQLPQVVDGSFRYTEGWFAAYMLRIFHQSLGIAKSEMPRLTEELFARFSRPDTFVLYPGAIELLEDLRGRKLKIGLVSNWSARLPSLLDRLDLARRVDFILCSAIERTEKPERAIFQRALSCAGVPAHSALHAGDDLEKDVEGARRAGIDAVLVDHSGTRNGAVERCVRDLPELARLVRSLI